MQNAIRKNPYSPWWINIGFCCYHLSKKEYKKAFLWAEKMDAEETFLDPLLKRATLFLIYENIKAKNNFRNF